MSQIAVVVLDDDKDLLFFIERKLKAEGITDYHLFQDAHACLKAMTFDINVVVIDHKLLGGETGLDIVRSVKRLNKENYVIGYSSITDPDILIEYINIHVDWFVKKDKDPDCNTLIEAIKVGIAEAADRTERRLVFYQYLQTKMS